MIRKRPSAVLQLLLPLMALTIGSTLAQAVKAENKASVDSSAILESVMCMVRPNPMQCIRQQAGRMLSNWEDILETKKLEMMGEADEEFQRRTEQRGLSKDDDKQAKQSPSSLMSQVEEGLATISEFVSDGVDSYASEGSTKDVEGGRPKKHLHHIIHKIGNDGGNGTTEGLARSDLDDDVTGLVDYGFGAGPEKAIGRGKQEGDQSLGYGGDQNGSVGGGSDSVKEGGEEDEDEQETGRFDSGEGGFGGSRRKRKGKKKKTFMKLFILGAALKGKIELLLKVLSFHLQLKFFAIAAIGLLINIARFWIDLKKHPSPQKVIYYEHAQHQHHYDEHGDDYGGYWKRSLHGVHDDDSTSSSNGFYDRNDRVDDEYAAHRAYPQPQQQQQPQHPHYVQQQTPNSPSHYPYDPHSMAYHQQRPYA
ncbi:uncharacterized protein LOC135704635 isoform X1 [Ochlerotatus camptorhynchus]|uniref:uncharacterized protein LOC135704635 isoform X1 n=1 Tax=Ochlerotatus camptorhynchus TaxID=644619 RepID=UPI0031DC4938